MSSIASASITDSATGVSRRDPGGAFSGFDYSRAMRKAGVAELLWDQATRDKFLENPMRFLPGTRMGYAGIKNSQRAPKSAQI